MGANGRIIKALTMIEMGRFPYFAILWARQLGADINSLHKLKGGINNQVFSCCAGSQRWIIKGYTGRVSRQNARMNAEAQFLEYANEAAAGFTPKILGVDSRNYCIIQEYIENESLVGCEPPEKEILDRAIQFLRLLNKEKSSARIKIITNAAEGFQSLNEHIDNIQARLATMDCEHLGNGIRSKAEEVMEILCNEFAEVRERTSSLINSGIIKDSIGPDQQWVSPGDFGFHNSIYGTNGIQFIDFEYAGWDDPAKTIVDFSYQPSAKRTWGSWPLLEALGWEGRKEVEMRCRNLEPILRLKWACIILSVLNRKRAEEISSVTEEQLIDDLVCERIARAELYLRRKS